MVKPVERAEGMAQVVGHLSSNLEILSSGSTPVLKKEGRKDREKKKKDQNRKQKQKQKKPKALNI
jgi:hypothetical protein